MTLHIYTFQYVWPWPIDDMWRMIHRYRYMYPPQPPPEHTDIIIIRCTCTPLNILRNTPISLQSDVHVQVISRQIDWYMWVSDNQVIYTDCLAVKLSRIYKPLTISYSQTHELVTDIQSIQTVRDTQATYWHGQTRYWLPHTYKILTVTDIQDCHRQTSYWLSRTYKTVTDI